jgi:hypothetical protein
VNYAGPGVYRHHKGKLYRVLGLARHSETEEVMVLYGPMYPTDWPHLVARPLRNFDEVVPAAVGNSASATGGVPRFTRVQP